MSATVSQISSNLANIQNILHNGLQQGHPELNDIIYSICHLNAFISLMGQGITPLIYQVYKILPHSEDHHLGTYVITEIFRCWRETRISDPDTLVTRGLSHFEHFDDPDLKC
jgi:hypothetical protein